MPSGSFEVNEDVRSPILGSFRVSDAESTAFGTEVTLKIAVPNGHGQLHIGGSGSSGSLGGVTISGQGTGTLILTGTAGAIEALLNQTDSSQGGLFYTSPLNANHDLNSPVDYPDPSNGDVTVSFELKEGDSAIGEGAFPTLRGSINLTINAVNDKPGISAPPEKVDIDSNNPIMTPGFVITDVDADNDYVGGENNGTIKVVVRLQDEEGKPFKTAGDYNGITLSGSSAVSGVTVVGGSGDGKPLELYGTREAINEYLKGLQVQFDVAGNSNIDGRYYLEVVVDDRIYTGAGDNWTPTNVANGGDKNQGSDGALPNIPTDPLSVYGEIPSLLEGNVTSGRQELFVSAVNDPAEIIFTNPDATGLERDESSNTVTLEGLKITDSDAQNSELTVTITLPEGFTFVSGPQGSGVTAGDASITLEGTLDELNGWFKDVVVNLPDVDDGGAILAEDWNGEFTFTVKVNDHGNTGVTSGTAPDGKGDNKFSVKEDEGGKKVLITTRDVVFKVSPTNDAPVVNSPDDPDAKVTLPAIDEDFTNSAPPTPGYTVGDLFGSYFDDSRDDIKGKGPGDTADSTAKDGFWGVAVVGNGAKANQGVWQYWSGAQWEAIPTDAGDGNALLLGKDTAIQFIPVPNWNGEPGKLTVRLVESNANGDTTISTFSPGLGITVDLNDKGGVGGTSVVSGDTVELNTFVNGVNDGPEAEKDTHEITEGDDFVEGGLITQPVGDNKGHTGVDTDVDLDDNLNKDPSVDEELTVTEVKNSDGTLVGMRDPDTGVITIKGKYGDLAVNPDGTYTYTLDNTNPTVAALGDTGTLTDEVFNYTITDQGDKTASSTLTITIYGKDDQPVVTNPPIYIPVNPEVPGGPTRPVIKPEGGAVSMSLG